MWTKHNLRQHRISFKYAFQGIWYTIQTQPNLRIHFSIAILVTLAGIYFRITKFEWLILLFTFLWVIISEMINTTVEAMIDLLTSEFKEQAKVAKDVAAGMVLIGAIGSVIIGLVIFLPYLT